MAKTVPRGKRSFILLAALAVLLALAFAAYAAPAPSVVASYGNPQLAAVPQLIAEPYLAAVPVLKDPVDLIATFDLAAPRASPLSAGIIATALGMKPYGATFTGKKGVLADVREIVVAERDPDQPEIQAT